MASKNERRAQKKREKNKKKRTAAHKARGSRRPADVPSSAAPKRADVREATGWPTGDCYLSETWPEHGPVVQGGFVRQHANGRCAAVFFQADLRRGGVADILAHGDVSSDAVLGEMVRRSEAAGHAMVIVEPDLVVKAFRTALELQDDDVAGTAEALALFGDLDGSGVDYALLTGEPPPPTPKKKSLFTWLFGE